MAEFNSSCSEKKLPLILTDAHTWNVCLFGYILQLISRWTNSNTHTQLFIYCDVTFWCVRICLLYIYGPNQIVGFVLIWVAVSYTHLDVYKRQIQCWLQVIVLRDCRLKYRLVMQQFSTGALKPLQIPSPSDESYKLARHFIVL